MSRAGQMAVSRMNDLNTNNVERIKIDPEKIMRVTVDFVLHPVAFSIDENGLGMV